MQTADQLQKARYKMQTGKNEVFSWIIRDNR